MQKTYLITEFNEVINTFLETENFIQDLNIEKGEKGYYATFSFLEREQCKRYRTKEFTTTFKNDLFILQVVHSVKQENYTAI